MQIFIQKLAQFVNKTVSLHQITSAGYLKRAWIRVILSSDTEEFYERTRSEHGRVGECKRWYSC